MNRSSYHKTNAARLSFSKEDHDVSKIFLAYLAFAGNCTNVGIALKMPAEVVEVLAAKEGWEDKLEIYVGLRHETALDETDRAIRRTVTHLQACHLRDIIQLLIDYIHQFLDGKSLVGLFSPRDPRTNRPHFNVKILMDLCRAFNVATRIINRASVAWEQEVIKRERLQLRDAMEKALNAMDRLPGVDSVAMANEVLNKWESPVEPTT
jgi:hypothetical protein